MADVTGLIRRSDIHLTPDWKRVVPQLFVAGEELASGGSRANTVRQRVLALSAAQAQQVLDDVLLRFGYRHIDLTGELLAHFDSMNHHFGSDEDLTPVQRMLLGAYATSEFSVEAAALCNPSIVAHPDQADTAPGHLRFVLSLRAIGEGHISSIEFRTGVLDPDGAVSLDDPGPLLASGRVEHSLYNSEMLKESLGTSQSEHEIVDRVISQLPPHFTEDQLDEAIGNLHRSRPARRETQVILDRLRAVTWSNYTRSFPEATTISQRVIRPYGPAERNGMEDARFVRFAHDDGEVTYLATYTAFDGEHIVPRLLETPDFRCFVLSEMTGRAATNKGMALFPRRIAGRYVALSRWDREQIALTWSGDGHHWDEPVPLYGPENPWEIIQIGNCGSPIETSEGWLVLTHGVGPMRTYSIGAILLDIDDPSRVIGSLGEPLVSPTEAEREGYVPNVVYSCGGLVHGDILVLPYAYGDRVTTFATAQLSEVLGALC